jgi:hypothetical protein
MRAAWVTPRLAPSPIALARSSSALTRSRSLAGSPTSTWLLARGLHIGADAAEPEQVDRALRIARSAPPGSISHVDAERACTSGLSGIDFSVRGNTPPPLRSATGCNPPSSTAAARTCARARPSSSPDRDRDRGRCGGGRTPRRASASSTAACRCRTRRPTCRRSRRRGSARSARRRPFRGNGAGPRPTRPWR